MPNENIPVCGCGAIQSLPKSRNGIMITKNLTILRPKTSKRIKAGSKFLKNHTEDVQEPKPSRTDSEGTSSMSEERRPERNRSKHEKRINSSRRTRSAERMESHYSNVGSTILGGRVRDGVIPEVLYSSVQGSSNRTVNSTVGNQTNNQNHSQPIYTIPSMTSPPPTYDVAMWQSGLPPTYEEYLWHKYAVISRSHTPPPPWSDSTNSTEVHRELLTSQPKLRKYLTQNQFTQAQNNDQSIHCRQNTLRNSNHPSNQQVLWERSARTHRARPIPSRSQSESRVQQQRITTMYEDAFCMETAVIQTAFDNGLAFCSLM